jgi:hypothetical protein
MEINSWGGGLIAKIEMQGEGQKKRKEKGVRV